MKHIIIILLTITSLSTQLFAQKRGIDCHNRFTFGMGAGYRVDFMKFTQVSPSFSYATPDYHNNYIASAFAYKEFGDNGILAIRPQLSFLRRGARYVFEYDDIEEDFHGYNIYAKYFDVRIPLILNFAPYHRNRLQPYLYVTPIFGKVLGGTILPSYDDIPEIKLTKANIAENYFALGCALGAKYNWESNKKRLFLGLEIMYDHGITDTYSKKEKDGKVNDIGHYIDYNHAPLKGKRLFKGLEFQIVFGISLKTIKKQKPLNNPNTTVNNKPSVNNKEDVTKPNIVKETPSEITADNKEMSKPNKDTITEPTVNQTLTKNNQQETIKTDVNKKDDTSITFSVNSATLTPENQTYLDSIAGELKKTGAKVNLIGHTDNHGSYAFNIRLSRERAKAVSDYLIKQGVDPNKITIKAVGYNLPTADNSTEQGRARNRRVELKIENMK